MRAVRILLAVLLTVLSGCVKAEGSFQEQLNARVSAAMVRPAMNPSFTHGLYSYYKEPSIGRIASEKTSNVFKMNDAKFIMNLKVSEIINARYYRAAAASSSTLPEGMNLLAEYSGEVTDYRKEEHPFTIRLYELEHRVYTLAESDAVEFFAISSPLEALQLSEVITFMARCVNVDRDAIIEEYSSRQNIDYSRKRLELFQNIAPENGAIEELFENHSNFAGRSDQDIDNFGDNYGLSTPEPEIEPEDGEEEVSSGTYETDNIDTENRKKDSETDKENPENPEKPQS